MVTILPEKFLEHLMPCWNNQWSGKVEILEVLSCAIFITLEWSIVFCCCWFKKDVNAFLSTFVIFVCLWYFFNNWTMQFKLFDNFSRLSLSIGLSPYLWNTWTNSNATQYRTTSWKTAGYLNQWMEVFCLVFLCCSLRHNLRLNEARRHNLIEWTR